MTPKAERINSITNLIKVLEENDELFQLNSNFIEFVVDASGRNCEPIAKINIASRRLLFNVSNLDLEAVMQEQDVCSLSDLIKCAIDIDSNIKNKQPSNIKSSIIEIAEHILEHVFIIYFLLKRTDKEEEEKKERKMRSINKNQKNFTIFKAYLQSWPQNDKVFRENAPLFWSIDKFKGLYSFYQLRQEISYVNWLGETIFTPAFQKHFPHIMKDNVINNNNLFMNTFKYVVFNVISRTFDGDGLGLVPLLDLFSGVPSYSKKLNSYHQAVSGKEHMNQLISQECIKMGKKFYINYGGNSANIFLLKYGFVEELSNYDYSYCQQSIDYTMLNIKDILFDPNMKVNDLHWLCFEKLPGFTKDTLNYDSPILLFHTQEIPCLQNEMRNFNKLRYIATVLSIKDENELKALAHNTKMVKNDNIPKETILRTLLNCFACQLRVIGGSNNDDKAIIAASKEKPFIDRCIAKVRILNRDALIRWAYKIYRQMPGVEEIKESEKLKIWNQVFNNFDADLVRVCNFCGFSLKVDLCSGCRKKSYCSKEHQRKDWKFHKLNCKK
eukprot:Pgem_evm1s11638